MIAPATTSSGWTDTAMASAIAQQAHIWRSAYDAAQLVDYLTLRDGTNVCVRAIRPDDVERLRAFHSRLSPDTIYLRVFSSMPELSLPLAERLAHMDYDDRMALVAIVGMGDAERIVALVRYERSAPTAGGVAFVVEDNWQGRGIATDLLYRLADHACECGFVALVAQTMGWNTRMHSLLRHCGFPSVSYFADALTTVRLDITQPPEPAYAA